MSSLNFRRFLIASIAVLLTSVVVAQAPVKRGYVRLTRIGPTVQVQDNATGELKYDLKEQPTEEIRILEKSTVLTVGDDSRVILVFSNGATITVAEKSILNIESYRQNPFAGDYKPASASEEPPADSHTRIRLEYGELVGNVKKLRPDSTFTVETPVGAAGIRGTTFRVVYRPQGDGQAFFSVTTLEGDVGVTTNEGTVDAPISVVDEQEVVIVIEVDDDTGEVTVVTPVEEIAPANADTGTLADMTAAVQDLAEAVVDLVFTAENSQTDEPAEEGAGETGDESAEDQEEQEDEGDDESDQQDSEETDEGEGQDEGEPGDEGQPGEEGAGQTPEGEGSDNEFTGGEEGDDDGEQSQTQTPPENDIPPVIDNADEQTPGAGQG
ncbi:FecR family protein [Actomonas aquatica]|uniref:FecR domain-containing protein n=1 Tax=Actomonas aquatica TaxID=2866162 RepID=A0ABZ1CA72_9BACT|nr:FecR family protein [Opitutus sp. WL0086]WRQ87489.1 FecR domain-containing protein [Opitutus sp. WL0086]